MQKCKKLCGKWWCQLNLATCYHRNRYDMKILEAGTGAMLGIEFGSLEWLSKAVLIFL